MSRVDVLPCASAHEGAACFLITSVILIRLEMGKGMTGGRLGMKNILNSLNPLRSLFLHSGYREASACFKTI